MLLDLSKVGHLAKLAKIQLTNEEKEKFAKDLASILDYVEKIKQLPVKKVVIDSISQANLRSDLMISSDSRQLDELNQLIPEKENHLVKTKPIFKK